MDHLTAAERSKNMARIKSKNTKPELLARKLLFANGLRYRLHAKDLPGKPDIYIKKYKTVIDIRECTGTAGFLITVRIVTQNRFIHKYVAVSIR